jgi:hypothetical protein
MHKLRKELHYWVGRYLQTKVKQILERSLFPPNPYPVNAQNISNKTSLIGINTAYVSSDPNTITQDNKQFSFNSALSTNNAIGNLGVGFRLFL